MAKAMAKVIANLCEKRKVNFNEVPEDIKAEVRKIIESDGYIIQEDGWVVKKEV